MNPEHQKKSLHHLKIAIVSMSDTRSLSEDKSGLRIAQQAKNSGHEIVFHAVIPDDRDRIVETVREVIRKYSPHALLMTGGTGVSPKDLTIEAVRPLFDKELTAFATLFAELSFQEIGASALLSRATAGIIGKTIVFCMPGSLNACQLACNKLIFPELGHIAGHIAEV